MDRNVLLAIMPLHIDTAETARIIKPRHRESPINPALREILPQLIFSVKFVCYYIKH